MERERLRDRFPAILSFFAMFRLKVCGQDRAHTFPYDLMVIRNQNFQLIYDFHVGWTVAGGNVFGHTHKPSRWLSGALIQGIY